MGNDFEMFVEGRVVELHFVSGANLNPEKIFSRICTKVLAIKILFVPRFSGICTKVLVTNRVEDDFLLQKFEIDFLPKVNFGNFLDLSKDSSLCGRN